VSFALWVLCEIAIVACDLAEVIGTAIALKLLFGLPLVAGVLLTALDVLLVLQLQRLGFRRLEAFIIALLAAVAACFALELAFARPDPAEVLAGFVPTPEIVRDPAMLYLAIGILGATVMPHNLYLHSAIVQTRRVARTDVAKREALRFATIDSTVALTFAMAINGAILVLAATTFHNSGETEVADIGRAYELLAPTLGAPLAGVLFAVALLASGQNSTLTATLAGQIVMEGFLRVRLAPWLRRLLTRLVAIIPAVVVALIYGEAGTGRLLILSQVVLSLQLPFAVIPLVHFTGRRKTMGAFANPPWLQALAVAIAAALVLLNAKLVADALL
jgi:manganese transport protein